MGFGVEYHSQLFFVLLLFGSYCHFEKGGLEEDDLKALDEGKETLQEIDEKIMEEQAKTRAIVLEMVKLFLFPFQFVGLERKFRFRCPLLSSFCPVVFPLLISVFFFCDQLIPYAAGRSSRC